MEISVTKNSEGGYHLGMGYVTFVLSEGAVGKIQQLISQRVSQSSAKDEVATQRKLAAYRNIVKKLIAAEDRIIQELLLRLDTELMVTIARLGGAKLYDKLIRNLSRQGQSQFEDDFKHLSRITEHKAILNMEKVVPVLKEVANKQKQLSREGR